MTTTILLIVTALIAVADWVAVARGMHRIELLAKPLTLVALIAATVYANTGSTKPWLVAALVFGLLGDIFLMFASDADSADHAEGAFMAGLGCFLLGHIAYVVAFTRHGLHTWQMLAGALVVGGVTALAMPRVLHGARERGGRVLAVAVGSYAAALGAMTVLGFGTAAVATAIGAMLFLVSDTAIAWQRFVHPLVRGPLLVIVTYHVAQLLIVVGMIR